MTMENQNCDFEQPKKCSLYIAAMDEAALDKTIVMVKQLRDEGYWAEYDLAGRGLKAQMKYANKIGASFVIVLGSNEIESGKAMLKNMTTGEQTEISLGESFIDDFSNIAVADMFSGVMDDFKIL